VEVEVAAPALEGRAEARVVEERGELPAQAAAVVAAGQHGAGHGRLRVHELLHLLRIHLLHPNDDVRLIDHGAEQCVSEHNVQTKKNKKGSLSLV
jgi:hypothetical protein